MTARLSIPGVAEVVRLDGLLGEGAMEFDQLAQVVMVVGDPGSEHVASAHGAAVASIGGVPVHFAKRVQPTERSGSFTQKIFQRFVEITLVVLALGHQANRVDGWPILFGVVQNDVQTYAKI